MILARFGVVPNTSANSLLGLIKFTSHNHALRAIVACGVSLSNAETEFVVVATAAYHRALETETTVR